MPTPMEEDQEPCLFPVLNTALTGSGCCACRTTPLQTSKHAIVNFSAANNVPPQNLFQLTWALVLRAFTGSQRPAFVYVGELDGEATQHGICKIDLHDNDEVSNLIQALETTSSLPDAKHLNTGLGYNRKGNNGESPPVRRWLCHSLHSTIRSHVQ
jgi:hypothetical protein